MVAITCFLWFLLAALLTVNALRRPVPPGKRFPPLWLPGMVVSELAPWLLVSRALIAAGFLALGAARTPLGWIGLILFALSEAGLAVLILRSVRSVRTISSGVPPTSLFRVWEPLPDEISFLPEVGYADGLTLDLYKRPGTSKAPTLIYLHPGSWMRGRPGRQARPMFHRLARDGWVILDVRYPLSPEATFPDHVIGVKRAIAWAKAQGVGHGVDPDRVAISGGSSGAHLAALAALTANDPSLQPGFEASDTSVIACVPFYGIFDMLVRNPTRYDWPFVARHIFKATPAEAPHLYHLGSPVDQVHEDAPPFLVIHGSYDSVVLPEESRHFAAALREKGAAVTHLEVGGAQHGFDAIASLRARSVGSWAAQWLNDVSDHAPALP